MSDSKHRNVGSKDATCSKCIVVVPENAQRGTCPTSLEPGESCAPTWNAGFTLNGTIECHQGGEMTTASCIPKSCPQQHKAANVLDGPCDRDLQHGETCTPDCAPGFALEHGATCLHGQLRRAKCVPQSCTMTCPIHGQSGNCPTTLKHGEVCQPTCDDGYETADVARCDHGQLVQAPCNPKGCSSITPPDHGTIGSCPHALGSGESCLPECDAGFSLVGETSCRNGRLTVAACRPAGCATADAIDGALENGDCPEFLEHGMSCTPTCRDADYVPSDVAVCKYGRLSSPACKPKACTRLVMPENATRGDCGDTLPHGASCTPKCVDGYTLSGQLSCDKGTPVQPECVPANCAITKPNHGSMGECSSTIGHDESCTPLCDEGYVLEGVTSCAFGKAHPARCVPKACPVPKPPENGAAGTCTAPLDDDETCQPTCDCGYVLDRPTSCALGRTTHGRCVPKSCPLHSPANGTMGDCPSDLRHGESCQVECDAGYSRPGPTTCTLGVASATSCEPSGCSTDIPADGAAGDCPPSLAHGESCTPSCPPGTTLSSDTSCAFGRCSVGKCIPDGCVAPIAAMPSAVITVATAGARRKGWRRPVARLIDALSP